MQPIATPQVFDLSAQPDERSVEAWEQHNAAALIGLSCGVPDNTSFRAKEVNLQLERVHLARVQGTPHTVRRDASMVSEHPGDSIVVYAALRGEALWEHAGARRVVRPGQLLVCDVDRPFLRAFEHGLEELAIKVKRGAFTEMTGLSTVNTPLFPLAAGDGANPYARALVRQVGRALGWSALPADEGTILELVAVIATGGRVGLPVAHRAAAREFIDDHLTDASLSAGDVAAGAGISERHLSRLFAETGPSVPQHILARRLDMANALLRRSGASQQRIVDVAASCGFTSTAYFSDSFKRRFGATAGEVRRGAVAEESPQRAETLQRA